MDWVVSQSDIEKHKKYNPKDPYGNLDEMLKDFGMDVAKGYHADHRYSESKPEDWPKDEPHFGYSHRSPFTGEVCNGTRYLGVARTDGKWKRFTSDFAEVGG